MWRYQQDTGLLFYDGKAVAQGYSGYGDGKNCHDLETMPEVGPLPVGEWTIIGPPFFSDDHGPFCLRLAPKPGNPTRRSGFLIHGDSFRNPGGASRGCLILTREARMKVWESGDRDLEVFFEAPSV